MKTLIALTAVAMLAACGSGEPQRRNSDYYGQNGGQGAGGAFNDSTSSSGSNGFGGDSGGGGFGSSGGGGDSGGGGGGSSSSGLLSTADGRWSFEIARDSVVVFDRGVAFEAVAIPAGARELTLELPDRAIAIDLGAAP